MILLDDAFGYDLCDRFASLDLFSQVLGSVIPKPPNLVGKDRISLSLSLRALRPEMAGMKVNLIASSNGPNWSTETGTVLRKK